MTRYYSDPRRASEPGALPDVEVWEHHHIGPNALFPVEHCEPTVAVPDDEDKCRGRGWYWHSCFPGCLPDGEPNGPFDTEAEAVEDAQQGAIDEQTEQDCIDCDGPCKGHDCHPDCGAITWTGPTSHRHTNDDGTCEHITDEPCDTSGVKS